MNQQKIQNEQSFNNRGHHKIWMFLLHACMYSFQISSFRYQMTQNTIYVMKSVEPYFLDTIDITFFYHISHQTLMGIGIFEM